MRTVFTFLLVLPFTAAAATKRWTADGPDDNWSTAANWTPAGAPVSGDNVEITAYWVPQSSGPPVYVYAHAVNDIAGLSLSGLTLTDASLSGQQVTLTGALTVEAGEESQTAKVECPLRLGGTGARTFQLYRRTQFTSLVLNGHTLQVTLTDADVDITGITGTEDVTFLSTTGDATVRMDGARMNGRTLLEGCTLQVYTPEQTEAPELGGEFVLGASGQPALLTLKGGLPLTDDSLIRVYPGSTLSTSGYSTEGNLATGLPFIEMYGGTLHAGNDSRMLRGLSVKPNAQVLLEHGAYQEQLRFADGTSLGIAAGAHVTVDLDLAGAANAAGNVVISGEGTAELAAGDAGINNQTGGSVPSTVELDGTTLIIHETAELLKSTQGTPVPAPVFTVKNGGVLEFDPDDTGRQTIVPWVTLESGVFRTRGDVRLEAAAGAGIAASGSSRLEGDGLLDVRCRISGTGTLAFDAATPAQRDDAAISLAASTVDTANDGFVFTGAWDIRLRHLTWPVEYRPQNVDVFFGPSLAVQTVEVSSLLTDAGVVTVRPGTTVRMAHGMTATQLKFAGDGQFHGPPASDGGSISTGRVELNGTSANVSIYGPLNVSELISTGAAGNVLLHSGGLGGSGNVNKVGGGLLRLAGAQAGSFSGTFHIAEGAVDVEKPAGIAALGAATVVIGNNNGTAVLVRCLNAGQLTAAHALEMKAGGTLDYTPMTTSRQEVLGSLAGTGGTVKLPPSGFVSGVNNTSTTFAGRLTGSTGIGKAGTGTLRLTGTSDYAGATRVSNGALLINGTVNGSGAEALDEGTLGGTGTVPTVTIRSGAVLAPGDSGGTLHTGSLVMESGARLSTAISGPPAAPVFGKVDITGTVSLAGAVLELTQSIAPQTGTVFRFVDNNLSDPIAGTFAGIAQGTVWSSNNLDFTTSYTGGTGNDFTLTFTGTNNVPSGQPPVFPAPAPVTVDERTDAIVLCTATDPDPSQTITWSLVSPVPAGATINAQTGRLRFITTESQGGTTVNVTVQATDNGSPPQSATATAIIHITDTNSPPNADLAYDGPIIEGTTAVFEPQNSHDDSDIPRQNLAYSILAPVPAGMTIDTTTGIITWVPAETQGGTTVSWTIAVTDDGTPPLTNTKTFSYLVTESNVPPNRPGMETTYHAAEGSLFTLPLATTDDDIPAQTLTYSIDPVSESNPPVAHTPTINSSSGLFRWQTAESDSRGPYYWQVRITDGAGGDDTLVLYFKVFVDKTNKPPVISPPGDKTIRPGQELSFRIRATDADLPAQTLSYAFTTAPPAGLVLDPASGEATWTPAGAQSPAVYELTVRVTDSGTPAKFSETPVRIWVRNSRPSLPALEIEQRNLGGYRLRFTLPADTLYEVQSTQNTAGSWTSRGIFTAPGGETTFIDNTANQPARRFYRLYAP